MDNFQRKGIENNTKAGSIFENQIKDYMFNTEQEILKKNYPLEIGLSNTKKQHNFDLGNDKYLIECKSHHWTTGNNVPSAKLTVWNEAMYYFSLVNTDQVRILFVEKSIRSKDFKSLATYYIEKFSHLIPEGVQIWEFDCKTNSHKIITHGNTSE